MEKMLPTVFHHALQEFDNDLGRRANENLSLSTLLGVGDVTQSVVEDGHENHGD